jgi:hypothetical protein
MELRGIVRLSLNNLLTSIHRNIIFVKQYILPTVLYAQLPFHSKSAAADAAAFFYLDSNLQRMHINPQQDRPPTCSADRYLRGSVHPRASYP